MEDRPRTEPHGASWGSSTSDHCRRWGQAVKRQKKNTGRLKEVEVVKSRESSTGKGNF